VGSTQLPASLTAGPWTATLSEEGALSRVSWNGREILRGLSVVVRTNTWLTVVPESQVLLNTHESGFTVTISARNKGDGVDFSWDGEISAHQDGGFSFSFVGHSKGVTSTNRIGLVALHSLNWAGQPCQLTHSDGTEEATSYPSLVSPHQPMKDIFRLSQKMTDQHRLDISFAGEVFEMEDQRNWTDASFKTYSRPLEWPFPYELSDGEKVEQAITLSVYPAAQTVKPTSGHTKDSTAVTITVPSQPPLVPWPQVGVSSRSDTDVEEVAKVWSDLAPQHLRVDIVCDRSGLRGGKLLNQALSHHIPVELAIHLGPACDEALLELVSTLNSRPLDAVFVYDLESPSTQPEAMHVFDQLVRPSLVPETPIFVGTDDNFTELNRNRVRPSSLGATGLTFGLNPQVHDSSEAAIIETAEAIPAILATAQDFSDSGTLAISPLVFKARRNIYAPGRVINRLGRDDDSVDPRLGSPFSAVWLMSTMAALIDGGVSRVTVDEIIGPAGIMNPNSGRSEPLTPFAQIVRWFATQRAGFVASPSEHPHLIALYGEDAAGASYAIANTSSLPAEITIGWNGKPATVEIAPFTFEIVRHND
jgi:D-apionolactonase